MERLKREVADRFAGVVNRQIAEADLVPAETMEVRLGQLSERIGWVENELRRLGPHVAAQGERIGILEHGYRPIPADDAQAAAVEHARARARGDLVSEYEERLNLLESLVGENVELD